MPVTVVPSAKQPASKKNRRQNESVKINDLASFIPLSTFPASGSSVATSSANKPPTIAVLRLTSTFLKLHKFVKDILWTGSAVEHVSTNNAFGRMEEAIDGFLLILDKDANIFYVSESIAGYVGLIQQDVIGQNLVDITHREFSTEIRDNLKPSLIVPSSVAEDCVISQFRQFHVRFVPSVSYSTSPSHSLVQVCGNLKVRLSPHTSTENGVMVIGFVGECHVIDSVPSIVEISVPCSSFIITRSADMKKVISVEATVKDVIGLDPEILLDNSVDIIDYLHPSDQSIIVATRERMVQTGHLVTPHFRFLTSSGDWVWMHLEATLKYKSGTAIPQFWEFKIRVLGQWRSRMKCIEQNELYSSKNIPSPTRNLEIAPKLSNRKETDGAKPIIDSLKSVSLSDNILEPVLHGRYKNSFTQNVAPADAAIPQQERSIIVQQEIGGDSSPSVSTNTVTDNTLALNAPRSSISDTGSTSTKLMLSVGCQTLSSFKSESPTVPHLSTPSSTQSTTTASANLDNVMSRPHCSDSGDKMIKQRQQVSFIDPLMSNQYLPVDCSFSAGSLLNSTTTLTFAEQDPVCDHLLDLALPGDDDYGSLLAAFSPFGSTATSSVNDARSYNYSETLQLETVQHSTTSSDPILSQFSPLSSDISQIPSNFNFVHSASTPSTNSGSSCMTSHIPDLSMLHVQQHGSCPLVNPSGDFTQLAMIEDIYFPVDSANSISLPQDQTHSVPQPSSHATSTSLAQDPTLLCTQTSSHDDLYSELFSNTETSDIQDILEQFL